MEEGSGMNKLDVMESLRLKEEELDNLLKEAREKASKIKKDALRIAEEINLSAFKEIEDTLKEYRKGELERIDKEIEAIIAQAKKEAEELRLIFENRKDKAVETIIDYLLCMGKG